MKIRLLCLFALICVAGCACHHSAAVIVEDDYPYRYPIVKGEWRIDK